MYRETIKKIIDALEAGEIPEVTEQDFRCFSQENLRAHPHLGPDALKWLVASWTEDDLPTFRRALAAIDNDEIAWLGFKVVYDEPAALSNNDIGVMNKFGETGSADAQDAVFFCNDAKEIISAREFSPRDIFQAKDATRGPGMHADQFAGLTWASAALFESPAVWLLGAGDLAAEVASLARRANFDVFVIDDDETYLNEERFPNAARVLLESWDDIGEIRARGGDYACVLTIGHAHDIDACLWATSQNMHYIGMLGSAGKNETVHDACVARGMTEEAWQTIKRPIGLPFGAKSTVELAIAIVGELIDIRYQQRYSEEERAKHDAEIGRGC